MTNNCSPSTIPVIFKTSEEAWFWCNRKNTYSSIERPCERLDILKIVERLYRQRRLKIDHLRVMAFYGVRQLKPQMVRYQERRAFYLWRDAMRILGEVLEQRNLVCNRIQRAVIDFSLERAQKESA